MLGLFQIYEQSSCRCDSKRETVYGESLQGVHLQLFLELGYRIVIYESPLFQSRNVEMVSILLACAFLVSSRHEELLRSERAQQSADIVQRALRNLKCSRRDIQKRSTALVLVECQPGDVVVLLLLEKLLVESHTGSHQFSNSALYYILCKLRIFKLVAHRHLIARADQSREICLKRMIWESRHRNSSWSRAGTLCEHDSENLAGCQRIIAICLIKIAAPEKKHCFRIFRLESKILLHHRCLGRFFLCHFVFRLYLGKNTEIIRI